MRWCPAQNCTLAVQANQLFSHRQNCMCECGQKFCFNCSNECHDPLPCDLIAKWKKDDYYKTILYLQLSMNTCPMCTVHIEKDDGRRYMVKGTFDVTISVTIILFATLISEMRAV